MGSNPPSSSMEDCCSSYSPCITRKSTKRYRLDGTWTTDLGTLTTFNNNIALIEFEPNDAIDGPLTSRDRTGDELTLGGEEVAVVEDAAQLNGDELITKGTDVPVEGETLEIYMRDTKDSCAGGLIASAGLDADKAIFNNIDTADTMFAGNRIQSKENLDGIGVNLFLIRDSHLDGKASLEFDGESLRSLGRIFRRHSKFPHVIRGSGVGILEYTGFVGDVEKVLIGRPGFGLGLGDGDTFLRGIVEECLPARKAVVEL